jgi:hypothetical protein
MPGYGGINLGRLAGNPGRGLVAGCLTRCDPLPAPLGVCPMPSCTTPCAAPDTSLLLLVIRSHLPPLLTSRRLLVGVAGLTFLLNAGGGLYWLIPAAVASLVGGVINAWLFLVKVTSQPR